MRKSVIDSRRGGGGHRVDAPDGPLVRGHRAVGGRDGHGRQAFVASLARRAARAGRVRLRVGRAPALALHPQRDVPPQGPGVSRHVGRRRRTRPTPCSRPASARRATSRPRPSSSSKTRCAPSRTASASRARRSTTSSRVFGTPGIARPVGLAGRGASPVAALRGERWPRRPPRPPSPAPIRPRSRTARQGHARAGAARRHRPGAGRIADRRAARHGRDGRHRARTTSCRPTSTTSRRSPPPGTRGIGHDRAAARALMAPARRPMRR